VGFLGLYLKLATHLFNQVAPKDKLLVD